MNTVVWQSDPDRDAWWQAVVGIEHSPREYGIADALEQSRALPLDDDLYPHTVTTAA